MTTKLAEFTGDNSAELGVDIWSSQRRRARDGARRDDDFGRGTELALKRPRTGTGTVTELADGYQPFGAIDERWSTLESEARRSLGAFISESGCERTRMTPLVR